jgi:hypothetical protein
VARKRDDYIEPLWITVDVDGETFREQLSIHKSGSKYQYSISYGDQHYTNTEDLMPSIWHCEFYGKMDLSRMVRAEKGKQSGNCRHEKTG